MGAKERQPGPGYLLSYILLKKKKKNRLPLQKKKNSRPENMSPHTSLTIRWFLRSTVLICQCIIPLSIHYIYEFKLKFELKFVLSKHLICKSC